MWIGVAVLYHRQTVAGRPFPRMIDLQDNLGGLREMKLEARSFQTVEEVAVDEQLPPASDVDGRGGVLSEEG